MARFKDSFYLKRQRTILLLACAIDYLDDDDFSATDWAEEFRGQYKTPMQLIEILRETAVLLKEGIVPNKSKSYWQDVLEQCKGWEADTDNEYAEEAR